MDKQIELLPCPWCGEKPQIQPWHGGLPTKVLISCENDEGCAVTPIVSGETPEEAASNWNHRTMPTPPAGQVEAVAEWKYCPECGCEEYEQGIWEKGNQEHICTGCGQSWFDDVDYSDVVRGHLTEWQSLKSSGAEYIAGLVGALEKLSCLGNEPELGTSDGNRIAQQALSALPPELRGK